MPAGGCSSPARRTFPERRGCAGGSRLLTPVQDVEAALALLTAARAEVDQLEAAVLFAARSEGLPWSRISRAMGLGSAQAAAQRYDRVSGRVPTRTESSR
jgi:hypothetical protein